MNGLDDELDLRYHRGLKSDVYYRCPTLESLDGALRNELGKSSLGIIPVEVVTEFVFSSGSTITIPVEQQSKLDAIGFLPADVPQSIAVEHALCPEIEGKIRLRTQRAIARSFIEVMQSIDGFKYSERQAWTNSDGTRFKYVCTDSLQNRDRKGNSKKGNDPEELVEMKRKRTGRELPTYDCGGAVHIKFSAKRDAVNVVYKHNPIHRDVENRQENGHDSLLPTIAATSSHQTRALEGMRDTRKKPRSKDVNTASHVHPDLGMSTSPEAVKDPPKKKRKGTTSSISSEALRISEKQSKVKQTKSSTTSKKAVALDPHFPLPSAKPIRSKECIRCREKRIKCNAAKPTCNQCQRGLWTCQYELGGARKRSKNGCLNCRQRRRKCTEERPSCAYCLKIDDDCAYPELTSS